MKSSPVTHSTCIIAPLALLEVGDCHELWHILQWILQFQHWLLDFPLDVSRSNHLINGIRCCPPNFHHPRHWLHHISCLFRGHCYMDEVAFHWRLVHAADVHQDCSVNHILKQWNRWLGSFPTFASMPQQSIQLVTSITEKLHFTAFFTSNRPGVCLKLPFKLPQGNLRENAGKMAFFYYTGKGIASSAGLLWPLC